MKLKESQKWNNKMEDLINKLNLDNPYREKVKDLQDKINMSKDFANTIYL